MSRPPTRCSCRHAQGKIAVDEARKLKIPVIASSDTTAIPMKWFSSSRATTTALRAIRLFASKIGDAVIAGRGMARSRMAETTRYARRRPPMRCGREAADRGAPQRRETPTPTPTTRSAGRQQFRPARRAGRRFLCTQATKTS